MIRVKNVSAYLDEPFILRMRVVPRSEQISSSLFGDGDFLCYGFSQLRALEFFVFRKMEMPETQNPPAMRVESICL